MQLPLRPLVCYKAWDHLIEQAVQHSYVLRDAQRGKGMSRFIADIINLPDQVWEDTRPDWLSEQDAPRGAKSLFPIWIDRDHCSVYDGLHARKQRVIRSAVDTNAVARVVLTLQINDNVRLMPHLISPHGQLGALLEAWGQGNLTPSRYPRTPPTHGSLGRTTMQRTRYDTVVW